MRQTHRKTRPWGICAALSRPRANTASNLSSQSRAMAHSAASPVLALVRGEPRRAAVGIRNHPTTSRERRRDKSLTPLEGIFGACRYDGYPHQQREHAHLERRECGCQPCIHADEHRHARRDEGTASEIGPGHMPRQPAWHQGDGILEIEEMSKAEEDQGHAV